MSASNVLEQLKNEHIELKKLLIKAQNCKISQRGELLKQIKEELVPHARGEEKTIYSLLKGFVSNGTSSMKDINLANEAYEEHRVIDDLLITLESINTHDEKWAAHLKVLKENVEHHIQEEEQELFKLIHKHFTDDRLSELKTVYLSVKATYAENLPLQSQIRERRPSPDVLSM